MKCAVYLRKSVDRDRDDRSVSIESQKAEILAWAEKQGAEVLEEWTVDDRGYSGSTANRPGFQRLLEAARARRAPFDTIVVYNLDRFFRHHRKQQRYLDEFEDDCKIRVVSVTEETDAPIVRDFKGILNEQARQTIIMHTRRAMLDIAKRGLSCGGTAPYGYRTMRLEGPGRPVRWEIDPETASTVRRIFGAYAQGASLDMITRTLNAEGLRTPGAGTLRSGRGWARSCVRAILMNETYTGTRVYGQTRKVSRKPTRQVRVPADQWVRVPGAHPAIIPPDLWRRAQEVRREKGAAISAGGWGSQAKLRARYLLSGYLVCAGCGTPLTVKNMNRGLRYYTCRRAMEGACSAPGGPVRLDIAEAHLETALRAWVLDPKRLSGLVEEIRGEADAQVARREARDRSEAVREQLKATRREIDQLVQFLLGETAAAFPSIREKLRGLEATRANLEAELSALDLPRAAGRLTREGIEAKIGAVRAALDHLTREERRELFELLELTIAVDGKKRGTVQVALAGFLARALDLAASPAGSGLAATSRSRHH